MPDIWSLVKTSDNKNIFYKLRYNILQISKETEAITQTWDASLCLLKITYTIVDKAKSVSLGLVGLQSNCACRHKNVKCQFLLQSCCTCHLSAAHHLVTKYKALFSLCWYFTIISDRPRQNSPRKTMLAVVRSARLSLPHHTDKIITKSWW